MVGATVETTAAPQLPSLSFRPQPGPQEAFLASPADVVIYGGAAGGGKTWGLILEGARHLRTPGFSAVYFRRTYPQVTNPGGLWDEAMKVYPHLSGYARRTLLEWLFPSGARIKFGHLQYESDKYQWQGAQIALLCFDELTHFSETTFFYMLSRNRSTCGVRPYARCTTNPDADSWVAGFISWWIDQDTGYAIPEREGKLRYFLRLTDGSLAWADRPEELIKEYSDLLTQAKVDVSDPLAAQHLIKSVTFISSRVYDNPALLSADPAYLANLIAQPLVERERLLGGNWKIRPAGGKVFNRAWFEVVAAVPVGGWLVRFWDFAATVREVAGADPDYTASVLLRYVNGMWYVEHVSAVQENTAHVDAQFRNLALQDREHATRTGAACYWLRWEEEGGSSGVRETYRLVTMMAGFDARGVRPAGDKLTRAKAAAVQAEVGNVKLLRGDWNEQFLVQLHNQPDWPHDDLMDAFSGAFNETLNPSGGSVYHGAV